MLTVWMDAWQMQCCGEPFGIGSRVTWTLVPNDNVWREWLGALLGHEAARRVTHREEHHGGLPEGGRPPTHGSVISIRAVRCRYDPKPDEPRELRPDVGSTTALTVRFADGWDLDDADARFIGYVVELDAELDANEAVS